MVAAHALGGHRAAGLLAGAPPRLRRADARGAQARDARPVTAGASPSTSSPAAATPSRGGTATTSAKTSATGAPTSTSRSSRRSGPRRAVRPRRRVLPLRGRLLRGQAAAEATHPDLLRRLLGGGDRGRRQARRRLGALGRAADEVREHIARVRAAAAATAASRVQRLAARRSSAPTEEEAWERAHAPRQVAERRRAGPRVRGPPESVGSQRLLDRRGRATSTTSASGRRSRRPPAREATRPRWSARRSRSPSRCSTTSTPARRPS